MDSKYYEKIRKGEVAGRSSVKIERWKACKAFFVCISVLGLFSGCASMSLPRAEKIPIDNFQAYNGPDGRKIYPESIDDAVPDVDILRINSEITSLLDETVAKIRGPKKRLDALAEILIQKVRYDTVDDRFGAKTAQETFDTGTGNCLSFSNLFIAMARHVGLKAEFQEIPTLPNWTREGEVLFFTRHIGASIDIFESHDHVIQLGVSDGNKYVVWSSSRRYLFAPSELDPYSPEVNPYSVHKIPDHRAFAQYYNNYGSQHLAEGDSSAAFRYFVKAIKIDPQLSYAWSNLGVVYSRNKQYDAAQAAYFQGLAVTHGPRDVSVMTIMNNMTGLYKRSGDTEKAAFYKNEVASFREQNPYYQYAAGKTAYYNASYEKSVKRFKEAIRLKDDEHLFYYGLALAYLKMGDIKQAGKNIDRARHFSWDDEKRAYYEQVRDKLNSGVVN